MKLIQTNIILKSFINQTCIQKQIILYLSWTWQIAVFTLKSNAHFTSTRSNCAGAPNFLNSTNGTLTFGECWALCTCIIWFWEHMKLMSWGLTSLLFHNLIAMKAIVNLESSSKCSKPSNADCIDLNDTQVHTNYTILIKNEECRGPKV